MLTFQVADMDAMVPRLMQLGASLDGAIRYEPYGKVAAVRSPDGHMLGLFEPLVSPAGDDDVGDAHVQLAAAAAAKAHLNHEADGGGGGGEGGGEDSPHSGKEGSMGSSKDK